MLIFVAKNELFHQPYLVGTDKPKPKHFNMNNPF